MSGELDRLLREAAQPCVSPTRRVRLTLTNPTDRELRRLRQLATTVNSNRAYGVSRARLEEEL